MKNFFPLNKLCIPFLLCPLLLNTSFISLQKTPPGLKSIVLDAGHGGVDSGTRGQNSREKDITLKVALKLGKALKARYRDLRVLYTRTTDVQVPLYKRIAQANNAKASLFISIHCNSLPAKAANRARIKGTETFVSGFGRLKEQDVALRENASILLEKDYKKNYDGYDPRDPESIIIFSLIKNANRDQSINFARIMQQQYRKIGREDRGYKEQSLAVLARAAMPAILTEIGFLSNSAEERYLLSASGQDEIVSSQLKAIEAYSKLID